MTAMNSVRLEPFLLKDAPALIETVFPAQKVSFEAQQERTAVQSQTLTGLGSYWKGRKPLILVRAVVLGSLLPQTADKEQDLELFEALMAFDASGLARRAVAASSVRPAELARRVALQNPWEYFSFTIPKGSDLREEDVLLWWFPLDSEDKGVRISWKRGISDEAKVDIYISYLATFSTYEERTQLCKRPEEVNQDFLLAPVWRKVNERLGRFGVNAQSMEQLIEQLGILRYGRRPKVGDTFAGGGSIPFEAARIGCNSYAADLNPIACMLNWGNFNIIGANANDRSLITAAQQKVVEATDEKLEQLGVEHDSKGNRAKAYLYCLETKCPETGWLVPLISTLVISKSRNAVAKLVPDYVAKKFIIEVELDATTEVMKEAEKGTVRDGNMVYVLHGKTYTTPIKTIRGDYRTASGETGNRLRMWGIDDFVPHEGDVFKERLYAIQWIDAETLKLPRQRTFFAAVNSEDEARERKVENYVKKHLADWQSEGVIPDMLIEPGEKTDEPIRTRGWSYWHHLFSARQLMVAAIVRNEVNKFQGDLKCSLYVSLAKMMDWSSKLCRYGTGAARESITQTFYNQAFNTNYSYGVRSFVTGKNYIFLTDSTSVVNGEVEIKNLPASELDVECDLWVTDPPYADAVNYHEIAEFFIAWLRKNTPEPFSEWKWDSRRSIAIKGDGDDFRRGMIDAYSAMTKNMPDNGMQCVMFTHQSTEVWSDMVGIFWAAGLQVVAAWYIATETTSDLKKGGYVQGTVTLMLRKRLAGEKVGFKQRILPSVRKEVAAQIEQMMHLNDEVKARMGEPVFNDADLQMAGYAAALKVLTSYTKIGETDVTTFALRPRTKGEITVVDEIVQQASEAANSLLVPEGVSLDTWQAVGGVQRFYLRMLDMESAGIFKKDNYDNFAKAFHVKDMNRLMASLTANSARLKQVDDFSSRDLADSTEIGPTWLGHLIIAIQQLLREVEPQAVVKMLMEDLPEYMEIRPKLIDLANFLSIKSSSEAVRTASEVLASRMQNQRLDS